jgi:tRNA(Ile)-lysidine synthase
MMDRLGPFEPRPRVAVAVSGGADSLAAAVLTRNWVRPRGGDVVGLVVDHGLRRESADEALLTCARLQRAGIASVALTLTDLARGPGIAARARTARHAVLEQACAERGILHLVFGHHAADQAETVTMRMLAGSTPIGLAGMAALSETAAIRRLRPLLGVPPTALRAVLRAEGLDWIEDPSNADPSQQRARLRLLRGDPAGIGSATRALVRASAARGATRAAAEAAWAAELAARVTLYPQGYALLSPGPIAPEALACLLATLSGAERPPPMKQVAPLAAAPRPATLAGVQVLPAGRLGDGFLLVREAAATAPPIPAMVGKLWDGRFRLRSLPAGSEGLTLGAWGAEAPRDRKGLPAAVQRSLPVLRRCNKVAGRSADLFDGTNPHMVFNPHSTLAGGRFFPLLPVCGWDQDEN